MNTLLIEGFTDAWRNLGAALRLFWPVALIYLVVFLGVGAGALRFFAPLESSAAIISFALVGVVVSIYAFLALCQGAVGWHRRILVNEAPRWISPLPRRRGLKYAFAVFLFGLVFLIGHMIVSSFTLPYLHSVFTSELGDIDLTNAPVEVLEVWRQAVWPIQVATFATAVILAAVILWFGRSALLIFPHIAIDSIDPTFRQIRGNQSLLASLVGALLIVYFLPSFVGVIYYSITPMSVQSMPGIRMSYLVSSIALSLFTILWGLSILSIAYRWAKSASLNEAVATA